MNNRATRRKRGLVIGVIWGKDSKEEKAGDRDRLIYDRLPIIFWAKNSGRTMSGSQDEMERIRKN